MDITKLKDRVKSKVRSNKDSLRSKVKDKESGDIKTKDNIKDINVDSYDKSNMEIDSWDKLDYYVISAVIEDRALYNVLEKARVERVDWLSKGAYIIWEWIRDYVRDNGELPLKGVIKDVFGVDLRDSLSGEGKYWVSEFLKRKQYRLIKDHIKRVVGKLENNDVEGAVDLINKGVSSVKVERKEVLSLFDLGEDIKEYYREIAEGKVGLPLRWKSLNDVTLGLWGGTATYFVARPGVGKTFMMILIGSYLWKLGYKVLFVSPEMDKREVASRFYMIESGVNIRGVYNESLSSFRLKNFEDYVDKINKVMELGKIKGDIKILDFTDDLTLYGIEEVIRENEIDIVLIDSIYMLDVKGDRSERTIKVVDWVRRAGKRFNIPFVLFHQLSRSATQNVKKGGAGYSTEAIALTDQLLWDANAVFIMEQDKDLRADRKLRIHVGKVRAGVRPLEPIEIYWDFENMNFEEIGREDWQDQDYLDIDKLLLSDEEQEEQEEQEKRVIREEQEELEERGVREEQEELGEQAEQLRQDNNQDDNIYNNQDSNIEDSFGWDIFDDQDDGEGGVDDEDDDYIF